MAFNLLDLIKGGMNSDLISKAASMLGENGDSIQKAMTGAVPTILSGMMHKVTDNNASAGIMNLIQSGQEDGNHIITSLFGDKADNAANAIAAHAGIKPESATRVLSMAAPLVSGGVGKALAGAGGIAGLAGLLFNNLDSIKAALPSGMLDKIGIGSLDGLAEKAKGIFGASALSGVVESTDAAHSASHGHGAHGHHHDDKKVEVAPFVKIFPWVGGLGVVALAWFLMSRGNQATQAGHEGGHDQHQAAQHEAAAMPTETNAELNDTVSAMPVGVLGEKYKVKIASGLELDIPSNGIEDRMIKFIENKEQVIDKQIWFNFDRINFATNSADLTKESSEQVNNMVEILKAYPAVEFKIGGYTDNVGNPANNISLSQKRADAVMNAIVIGGINATRVKAEGFGDQFPEASNDTEEGKAKNRRIAVSIRKK
jgi:outer membrane protein OmpA-like peptidoglycan-associated protein